MIYIPYLTQIMSKTIFVHPNHRGGTINGRRTLTSLRPPHSAGLPEHQNRTTGAVHGMMEASTTRPRRTKEQSPAHVEPRRHHSRRSTCWENI
jgi:hypothetical protein